MTTVKNVHADWIRKRREALIRREADEQILRTIRRAVGDRVGRLRVAAENLDQQRSLLESHYSWVDLSK